MKEKVPDKQHQQIDRLDEQILRLLNRRARAVRKTAQGEAAFPRPGLPSAAERQRLRRLCRDNPGPFPKEGVEAAFTEIDSACRSLTGPIEVYFLGPSSTYAHAAAVKQFGRSVRHLPMPGVAQVFQEVEKRPGAFGVVPIENSSEGVVGLTLDLLLESPLSICSEIYLPIRHHLLSNNARGNIRTIYTHSQAAAQCRAWLAKNLPGVEIQESASTVRGVELALKDKHGAAIAGQLAADLYAIRILARNIHDRAGNTTRFVVIGHEKCERTGKDKTSIIFWLKNRVGALFEALQPFRAHRINLTKIESRPTKREAWEYAFYIDLEGHQNDTRVQRALTALEEHTAYLKILGSYPDATRWSLA